MVNVIKIKQSITKAFNCLRKKGILARQNFLCCQTCGSYDLNEQMKKLNKKGYTFYHKQDNDRLLRTGQCYLAFDSLETGKLVYKCLKQFNLNVEWNNDENTRIFIKGEFNANKK